jgi:hypothetical protein
MNAGRTLACIIREKRFREDFCERVTNLRRNDGDRLNGRTDSKVVGGVEVRIGSEARHFDQEGDE